MKHGRSDYQRITDPAANDLLISAYHAALAAITLRDGEAEGRALDSLVAALTPTLGPIVDKAFAINPIRADEPVFLMRASDKLAPSVVREYARQLRGALPGGTPMWKQSDSIIDVAIAMEEWQQRHGAKLPDLPEPEVSAV